MLLRFFGLNEDPFGVTPAPRFLYSSHTHREALASLKYGLQTNRGFTALIAPPGLGKTTLLYHFLNDIRPVARSVFLFDIDAECSPRELIGAILRDLGITPAATATGMHDQLNQVLLEESRAGRTVVIVVDEAQNLSESALETLRLLSNFETPRAKLLHIVMAGQLQLLDKLTEPSLVQLRQRITTFCRIDPFSAEETRDYICHRLTIAGYRGEALFSNESLDRIYAASGGIPRTINNLCFNALSICRALNQKQVAPGMVEEAIADLHLDAAPKAAAAVPIPSVEEIPLFSRPERESRESKRQTMVAVAALCASILAIVGFAEIRAHQLPPAPAPASVNTKVPTGSAVVPGLPQTVPLPAPESTQPPSNAPAVPVTSTARPFKVKVARHYTLRDVAMQYLGEFDEKRLREIQALNPELTDPDHLLAGQSIWLPGPPRTNLAQSEITPSDPRSIP